MRSSAVVGIGAGQGYYDRVELDELRGEGVRLMAVAVALLAVSLDVWFASLPSSVPDHAWLIVPGLLATAGLALLARCRNPLTGALALVAGLWLVLSVASWLLPGSPLPYLFPLVVFLASGLIGWQAGAGMAAAVSLGLLAADTAGLLAPPGGAGLAAFAVWMGVPLAWMMTRPTQTALDWSWHSYSQLLARTEELRDRQGELARLSEELSEAVYRLEQANRELDRARRAADEARRLKADFAAMISHELRTPLNLIIGFGELLLQGLEVLRGDPVVATFHADVEAIYRNACHLSGLVNDVLDLSQVEARRLALKRERVELAAIVEDATTTVATMLRDKHLSLEVSLAPDLPTLFVDRVRIRQILVNLLVNAVRFTESGNIRVAAERSGDEVVVSVTDTGVGIASDDLPRVFEEFQQFHQRDDAPWRRQVGSGLGLSICRRFAELHGGTTRVTSEPGRGSTFYLTLPFAENVAPSQVGLDPAARYRVRGEAEPVGTIAVVSEDCDAAEVLQRYLPGYHVVPARGVDDLLGLAVQPLRGVVTTTEDGRLLWERARAAGSAFPEPPVARVSLLGTPRDSARRLGVAAYLLKPVDAESLVATLRRVAGEPRHLLIVEDEPEMARLLERIVGESFGSCVVELAGDGAAGLGLMRECAPDVVLLDLLMPGLTGYQVVEEMHRDARLRDVPVVVVTARGDDEQPIVATSVEFTRPGGLSIRDLVGCLRAGFDAMEPATGSGAAAPRGAPQG